MGRTWAFNRAIHNQIFHESTTKTTEAAAAEEQRVAGEQTAAAVGEQTAAERPIEAAVARSGLFGHFPGLQQ